MIEKYIIKKEDNEEVLYLYLNYNYEFSKIDFINTIKKKINFKGLKIVLIVGGVAFSTILLNKPIENININDLYVNSVIFKNFDNKLNEIEYKVDDNNILKKSENTKQNNKINEKENIKQNKTVNKIDSKENVKQNKTVNKIDSANIISIKRSNGTFLNIELEEYLIGVVAAEMPASFDIEALKAQSVIARTYALKRIKNNQILTDNVETQAYKDNEQLKKMWSDNYEKYYNKIKEAVLATKNITVKYNNDYIEAVYHSTSNGLTENAEDVWDTYYPYLISVKSYDETASSFYRETIFSYDEINKLLNIKITRESNIQYIYNDTNRVQKIIIDDKEFDAITFRNLLKLRSTDFNLQLNDNVKIITKGYGHGVGMSQYGANEMAKLGYNYKQIINHYYSNVTIE